MRIARPNIATQGVGALLVILLIAYLLALLYLSTLKREPLKGNSLRVAWVWFSLIPISHFVFALFRAGNLRSPKDLALIEIWDTGISWLFLGISMLFLAGSMGRDSSRNGDKATPPRIPDADNPQP